MSQFNCVSRSTNGRAGRAVIYCRVSSTGQEDNSSLGTQEEHCRAYAIEQGWTVVAVYREVHTGADLFERPQLSRLRETVRSDETDIVLAYALDRLSRSQAHLGFLLSEWDHMGVRLAIVSEDLDETPEGRLLQSVRGFVAEMERLKIAERTQRGIRKRVQDGKPLVGWKAPYGYQWMDAKKTRLEEDPLTSVVARRVFRESASGQSLRSIALRLAKDGIPSPSGNPHWSINTIRKILSSPIYVGDPRAFRTKCEKVRGRGTVFSPRPDYEQVALPNGVAPALIDRATQEAALARLARNKAEATRHSSDPEATLLRAGFVRCGHCGHALHAARHHDGTMYLYRCNRERGCPNFSISARVLDRAVWQRVESVLTQPDIIAGELERRRGSSVVEEDLATLESRLATIEHRRQRVARAVVAIDDDEAASPLLAELKSLSNQKRDLQAERESLLASRTLAEADRERLLSLADWCNRVIGNLPGLSYKDKRDVLSSLNVQVRVWPSNHSPRWEMTMDIDEIDAPIVSTNGSIGTTSTTARRGTRVSSPMESFMPRRRSWSGSGSIGRW